MLRLNSSGTLRRPQRTQRLPARRAPPRRLRIRQNQEGRSFGRPGWFWWRWSRRLRFEKENTSPLWHREDQVLRESPALIVIHRSCFADAAAGFDPQSTAALVADKKIESFLGYISLGNPSTKFLVYTRRSGDQSSWTADMEKRFPQLAGRIHAVTVRGGPEHATFRDPETAKMVRENVK